jgi:hypothetical protein
MSVAAPQATMLADPWVVIDATGLEPHRVAAARSRIGSYPDSPPKRITIANPVSGES